MRRALAMTGSVSVNREGGSAGAVTAMTTRAEVMAEEPGNTDAVWPSAPIPSRTTSKTGGVPAK